MKIIAGPGQGAQAPGFLAPWLELPGVRETLEGYSDIVGIDLVAAGTVWDSATITDTAVAQPLLVAAGLIAGTALLSDSDIAEKAPLGFAGHSVGEVTAAALAGVFTPEVALSFVTLRGAAMAQAARDADSGMIAVLSRGDLAAVAADIEAAGLTPANFNGSGQIVAAGGRAELDAFIANPSAGVKVIPLKVAGAFHSPYMLAARARLEDARATFSASTPRYPIYTNRDGSRVTDGTEYLDDLIAQVAHPVRWDMCQESFLRDGVDALIELTPAGTLTGLARKGLPGVPTVALKTPEDIEAARALLQ